MKYTLYIVRIGARSHRPYLIAGNGKPILNEVCANAGDIENTFARLSEAIRLGEVEVVRISEAKFRELHPSFPKNAGPKKKAK